MSASRVEEAYQSKRGNERMENTLFPSFSTPHGILPRLINHPSDKLEVLAYKQDGWDGKYCDLENEFQYVRQGPDSRMRII